MTMARPNSALQTDDRRTTVSAYCRISPAPLAAEAQNRWADGTPSDKGEQSGEGKKSVIGSRVRSRDLVGDSVLLETSPSGIATSGIAIPCIVVVAGWPDSKQTDGYSIL